RLSAQPRHARADPPRGRRRCARATASLSLAFALAVVALPHGAAAQEPFVLPPALADAIKRLDSAASVVRADEILEERCGAAHRRDQLFRADFNGDGRQDYAALLRVGEPEGKPGEALRTAPLWAVVFL